MGVEPHPATRRLVSPVQVGRAAELAAVLRALSVLPAVVILEGEAGVGKSRLVTELLDQPEVAKLHSLLGRCHQIRESFPLGPVIEAVRGLDGTLRGKPISAVAGALRPLLPELGVVLPPAPEPLDDRKAERHRVFRGLTSLLDQVGPSLLVLEDLHWADEQTIDFIAYLMAEPPARLAVIITHRAGEAPIGLQALTSRPSSAVAVAHVRLEPLDQAGTAALIGAILGTDTVSPEFAGHLWGRTQGLPFAIEEVLALEQARGLLVRHGGKWSRRALDELEVPRSIRDSTLERVSRLPAAARRVVEAAAALQYPVPVKVLLEVVDDAAAIDAVETAIGSGLLTDHSGQIGYRHVLAAQAVYANLSGPRQYQLHGRAADVLNGQPVVPLGQVAHHLKAAGRLDEWAATAQAAAAQAIELGHDTEATRLLEDVLRNAPLDTGQRGRVAAELGWAALETLHMGNLAGLLAEVLEHDLPRPVRGELRYLLAAALNAAGQDRSTQTRLLALAVDDLEDRPESQAKAMIAMGIGTAKGDTVADVLVWLDRAVARVTTIDDPLVKVDVLGKAGGYLVDIGEPRWRSLAAQIQEITSGTPRQRREVTAYYALGVEAGFAGHLDVAERLLTAARQAPATRDSQRLDTVLRSGMAVVRYLQGAWDGLAAETDDLLEALSDYAFMRLDVEVTAGCLALAQGAGAEARQRLDDAVSTAERLEVQMVLVIAAQAAVRAALAHGTPEQAVAYARRGLVSLTSNGAWAPAARLLPAAVQAMLASGAQDEAWELVQRAEREWHGLDVPLGPAAIRYARGLLNGSILDFLEAAQRYTAVQAPYDAAQAFEHGARRLLETGQPAAQPLRSAVATYERLGATWDRARAASLARQYGLPLPAVHRGGNRGYGDELSPRERQVTELAAAGRTNNEIAKDLFLSRKTVEKHLGAAMQKLHVHSRVQLAARWRQPDEGSTAGKNGGLAP